ncbi:TPA: ATP-binding cassette domain-containing protein [Candidatus Poribacteria bacterium]|nr:ATP-binding cassette domain-containing protein [Candidatus Poribacteria bacterium]HIA67445.1 ATP-binding cassette domain-containing protein [Candidatus Poribacteria bacterium]HIB89913.1 ATP-binding cassette domain-containing protein [Candidatus Poribacteria bacterium]HIB98627.1 ATP-binding cassette domain-containing protein [Candidatus Poribacteria bacterium]HIN30272.1 ATP-binding cassette domain-containing protein [Candidatus Poribacteria bacterium]
MIQLKNVSKNYGSVVALCPTDLNIEKGKVTALIGPSGCGKSTILRLINGLIAPTQGVVEFEGQTISPNNILEIRRRTGYVIQDGGLFPHLTASQNVLLMPRELNQPRTEMQQRLEELCRLTDFPSDLLNNFPGELSGGQRQRVSLMRSLTLDPGVLLLDEPLGALDPIVRSSLQQELKDIFQSLGKTVVLVTHDLHEAAYLGDVIVLLKSGQVVQQGTLDQLQNQPADTFVTKFITSQRSLIEI